MFPSGTQPDAIEVSDFPNKVIEHPHLWIPLPDGTRLAARLWHPEDAERNPVPAIIECIPYRKRDATSGDDERMHPYFAGHGYAALRIDLRGSGDSDGVLEDEYLTSEQDDLVAAIAWIADQVWCDGNVGMMGISWGGFNSLQVASRQPPELKAIIAVGATVDRYHDDGHYKGGAILNEHFGWAASSLSFMSRPPDPALREDWREQWRYRLERQPFVAERWFSHQTRDDYWRHGSVCEDYSRLRTPILAVTGWADAYVNFVAGLLEHASCPRLGIVGPWPHAYPHVAIPGPTIGFLQEAVRWWDHWLKGIDRGIMREPQYRVYCQQYAQADNAAPVSPGEWLAEPCWPSATVNSRTWHLDDGRLRSGEDERAGAVHQVHGQVWRVLRASQDTGWQCGEYIPHCAGPEIAGDQRLDDARSLCFDMTVPEAGLTLLGRPQLKLRLSVDRPQANLIVRLCDVGADGTSQRVSYGVLNLTHRDGHREPSAVPIDTPLEATVTLNQLCHRFLPGQRLRVSVTTAYWPLIWPGPEAVTLRLDEQACRLTLPIRGDNGLQAPTFEPAVYPGPVQHRISRAGENRRSVCQAQDDDWTKMEITDDFGEISYDHGLVNSAIARERYCLAPKGPASASMTKGWTQQFRRGDWEVSTETRATLRCDREAFFLEATLKAYDRTECLVDRRWQKRIPRSGV